jgi:hypothetical protein
MNLRNTGLCLFKISVGLILPIFCACQASVTRPYTGVLTYHNDNARTGANLTETVLTPANVNSAQFGKLHSYALDGVVYAQPLYVRDVDIHMHGRHNVVVVATEHDSIYAFDADGKSQDPVWKASFADTAAGVNSVSLPYGITSEMGITGTPVIDANTGTLYAVTFTDENGKMLYRLRALDITSGTEMVKGGTIIQASTRGTGDGNDGHGNVVFNPLQHLQRPGLLLSNGVVYIAFGSFWDLTPYHGWLLGYDAKTLQQESVFNVTPNGSAGSIWMSGGAPAADESGNIFIATANGTFDADSGGVDFGQSVLKLGPVAGGLTIRDYFTPYNYSHLNDLDLDLGSGGIILVPNQGTAPTQELLITGGKDASLYMTDRVSLGKFHQDGNQIVQSFPFGGGMLCTPAYWQNRLYFQQAYDLLRAYSLNNGVLSPASNSAAPSLYGGATPVVSANGNSNGIVWVEHTNAVQPEDSAILLAYDASDLSHELYDSTQAGNRDMPGPAQGTRFTVPTVFNGKVYLVSGSELDIFGLLGS